MPWWSVVAFSSLPSSLIFPLTHQSSAFFSLLTFKRETACTRGSSVTDACPQEQHPPIFEHIISYHGEKKAKFWAESIAASCDLRSLIVRYVLLEWWKEKRSQFFAQQLATSLLHRHGTCLSVPSLSTAVDISWNPWKEYTFTQVDAKREFLLWIRYVWFDVSSTPFSNMYMDVFSCNCSLTPTGCDNSKTRVVYRYSLLMLQSKTGVQWVVIRTSKSVTW